MLKNKLIVTAGIIAGTALLGLAGGFFYKSKEYFTGQFGRNTFISNTNVSSLTVDEAVAIMNESRDFTIECTKNGTSMRIDISPAVTREFSKDEVVRCMENFTFLEYFLGREKDFQLKPVRSTVDEGALRDLLEQTLPETTAKAEDAYINEDFQLVPEKMGDEIDLNSLIRDIKRGIDTGLEMSYVLEAYYIQPELTKDNKKLEKAAKQADAYAKMKIAYKFGKEKEVIDWDKLKKYLKYDEDKIKLELKTNWVEGFVKGLAKKYNTYGKTREFKSTKDGRIKIKGGIMGWWIDEAKTVEQLKKLLAEKKGKTLEPVYRNIAAQHGKDDIGNTYVEVSLKRQHLWYYKNGKKKLESDVVTGKATKDRQTTVGVHRIYGKQRDRYLGTIAVQGYHTFVNYWMPFNWDGQGLHDATWRSKFGGNIYKTSGSHGCVNLPYDFAAKLYEQIEIGTPVVVY